MKNFLKYVAALAIVGAFFVACSDWTDPEREITQHPDQQSPILRDNAYYQALREYKKTKHKIAFGWYGSWTAVGASYQTRLQSAPDSMDIISIWSQWHSLTPEQIADKEFVQKIKGTKVTFTIFSDKMPEPFLTEIGGGEYTDEAIEAYAKAYCKDSMDKYSYDGIDVDYEPGYGASGPFVGHDNELFRKLILAMSKYVGPKSGTGRLLMIDGVPYAVHADVADCFDYGIVQAYNSYGYTDLQDRFDDAYKKGWKPEQYIFAENFESLWKTGGVSHECRDGQWVNSLLGMARFNPTQGFGAGFGAYHMEYEYANSSMPYKYMREAIQDVNPAGGDLIVGLTSTGLSKYLFLVGDDGTITGEVDEKIRVELARPAPADVSFPLAIDNSLVDAYNEKHGTSYEPIDPARVSLGTLGVAAGAFLSDEVSVTVSSAGIEKGYYLIPIVVELPAEDIYTSKEPLVRYLLLTVSAMEIDVDATALTGVKIEPASGWTIVCTRAPLRAAPTASGTSIPMRRRPACSTASSTPTAGMPRMRPIRGGTAATSSSRWTRPTTSTASAGISTTRTPTPNVPISSTARTAPTGIASPMKFRSCPNSRPTTGRYSSSRRPSKPAISGYTSAG